MTDTALTAREEQAFRTWKQRHAPNDSGEDYDLRGAFKAGLTPDTRGHWPDTFKKPNHPTFSVESVYAREHPDRAGSRNGETYVPASPGATRGNRISQTAFREQISTLALRSIQSGDLSVLQAATATLGAVSIILGALSPEARAQAVTAFQEYLPAAAEKRAAEIRAGQHG